MPRHITLPIVLALAVVSSFTVAAAATPPPTTPLVMPGLQPPGPVSVAAFPTVTAPDPVVQWMVDQVKQDTVRQYVGDLSGEWPVIDGSPFTITTRYTTSGTPIHMATQYVGDRFRALGLLVDEHSWGPVSAPNVIGEATGSARPGDIYIVSAHLDDAPGGGAAPGADDNASGSTAVLVAAEVLSQFSWNCTIRFALWTGEEQGLMGSDKYAHEARAGGENILGVLNLDMIGWNSEESSPDIDLHAKGSRPGTVALANQMASVITAYEIDLVPEVRADGTGASDHASFWAHEYDAILAIEDYYPNGSDFDPYYHTSGDRLDTLDLGYFTEYVKAAVGETTHMASCLVTGILQGTVLAAHDNSPIAAAEVRLKDEPGREYALRPGVDGGYSQAVPPGMYSMTVSAYGYSASDANGLAIPENGSTTEDFVLTAAQPAATAATVTLDAAKGRMTWPHVSPNTRYQVRRGTGPYFAPETGTLIASLEANHPPSAGEALSYRDAESASGDANTNHFYVVLAMNAAGATAASGRTGEFDFELAPGTGL